LVSEVYEGWKGRHAGSTFHQWKEIVFGRGGVGCACRCGIAYLTELPGTDEFRRLMEGIGIMGLRAAITKAAAPEKDPNAEVG
jgi:hypothetical protein